MRPCASASSALARLRLGQPQPHLALRPLEPAASRNHRLCLRASGGLYDHRRRGGCLDFGQTGISGTIGYRVPTVDQAWQVDLFSTLGLDYDFGTRVVMAAGQVFSPTFGGQIGGGIGVQARQA